MLNQSPYTADMMTIGQARKRIWKSIAAHGGPSAVAREAGISLSMLFKFRGASRLGRESANALALVLTDVDVETWAAAMGLEVESRAVAGKAVA